MAQEKEANDSKGLVKSSAVVGGMTFISRISGFLRDVVFANIFGASAHTDAFFISFKIPNFFRRLFAEGALIQAFVPILNDIKENDRDNLKRFISYMQGNLAFILILIVTLGIIFSETVINIFAPGFGSEDDRLEVASAMLKITFPYLFFISLTALSAGILNTHNRFFFPAITPVILNLSLILSAFYLTDFFENPIIALAYQWRPVVLTLSAQTAVVSLQCVSENHDFAPPLASNPLPGFVPTTVDIEASDAIS